MKLIFRRVAPEEYPEVVLLGNEGQVYKLLWVDDQGVEHEVEVDGGSD